MESAWENHLLFTPAAAIRAPQSTYAETPIPLDEPLAPNPPGGAVIDYYLARPASGRVTIEILDASGTIVRAFASDDPPELTPEELQRQLIPPSWARPPRNPETAAGMHRFVWDLHGEKPLAATHEYPITAVPGDTPRHPRGPLAVPGAYTVSLTAGGRTHTAPLTVRLDQRVKTLQAGLEQMLALQRRLASLIERVSPAVLQAASLREQTAAIESTGAVAAAIKALEDKVTAALDGPENPPAVGPKPIGLQSASDDALSIYGMVSQVDAAPTAAQVAATATIERGLPAALGDWGKILGTDLPALNAILKQAGLPELDASRKQRDKRSVGSEEQPGPGRPEEITRSSSPSPMGLERASGPPNSSGRH